MKKDPQLYFQDILESIKRIEEYVGQSSKSEFLEDHKTQDAVIRQLCIIGEAANKLDQSTIEKNLYPLETIDWNAQQAHS